jgi:hypothetical protein
MSTDSPPPLGAPLAPPTPGETLQRLVDELERWGELFISLAREDKAPAAEQVLGGLVDWTGNGLMDGWLHLPIPVFEEISNLAEELLEAFQGYLAWLRTSEKERAGDGRSRHEVALRGILARARGCTVPGPGRPAPNS